MEPATYLDKIKEPLLSLLLAISDSREWPVKNSDDVRQVIGATFSVVTDRINVEYGKEYGKQTIRELHNFRSVLGFLRQTFNRHAHNSGDTAMHCLGVVASVHAICEIFQIKDKSICASIDELKRSILKTIAGEYVEPSENPESELSQQIQALHDKIDALVPQSQTTLPDKTHKPQISSETKRKHLEAIRADIRRFALDRKYNIQPYEFLIQLGNIESLIRQCPTSIEELKNWASSLPSYPYNKKSMDRQIERWGNEIVELMLADVEES